MSLQKATIPSKLRDKIESERLCERYGIQYIGLFGSFARGENTEGSDIDLYIKFSPSRKVSLFDLSRLQRELETDTQIKYDLVTKINKHVEPYMRADLISIYGKEQ
ncbi:nucleotidyltransferase domain-containing protein [Candidatus Woesebacteria bacterium]|nr:nucleotidyltransferase domain-containing protein [Candidatus Woesebacteria bacterium]